MAQGWLNRCIFTATTGTTADFEVASPVNGYITPDDAGAVDTDSYHYFAQSDDLSQWEVGTGPYTTTGAVLGRVPILSSNGNALVNFSAAPKVYMGGPLAADLPGGGGGVTNPLSANLDTGGYEIGTASGPSGTNLVFRAGTSTADVGANSSLIGGNSDVAAGGAMILSGGEGATVGGTANILGGGGPDGGGNAQISGGYSSGANGGNVVLDGGGTGVANGGSVLINGGFGEVDGGDVLVNLPGAGTGRQGFFFINNLPSSDPGIPGALYHTLGALMISL